MHFEQGSLPPAYTGYILKKKRFLLWTGLALVLAAAAGICLGAVPIAPNQLLRTLVGDTVPKRISLIIWQIRLPQILTALVAGAGLAGSGAVMQSVLKNPLASPFTLGIAHAAAFGAACSVLFMGAGTLALAARAGFTLSGSAFTLACAFGFAMSTALVITLIAKTRAASPEVMVLTGVALGSLFTAGTMLLQYFADDVQLAAMVFWTFGDVGRAQWQDLAVMVLCLAPPLAFFVRHAFQYNAMAVGDETAQGLGVRVTWVRLSGMVGASFVTSVIIAHVGVIGFIGLVAPHMVRRLIGEDHRFLLPGSILAGALILLVSDTVARLILLPHVLPVSIFTAFLGAPIFIYLITKTQGGRP